MKIWRDLRVTAGAMASLMADLLSSRMTVGVGCGWPRSAANWRKNTTSLAHLVRVLYSVSHGLSKMSFSRAE